jgi:complex III assembly factor LYRM7
MLTGDNRILLAARQRARTEFDAERSLTPGGEAADEKIRYALEVSKVLREEVLQGEAVEGHKDRYRMRSQVQEIRGD